MRDIQIYIKNFCFAINKDMRRHTLQGAVACVLVSTEKRNQILETMAIQVIGANRPEPTSDISKHWEEWLRARALHLSSRQRHRGPDSTGIVCVQGGDAVLCHERLSIVGINDVKSQPFECENGGVYACVMGEIYNYRALREFLEKSSYVKHTHKFKTHSDCEVIPHLYKEFGPSFVNLLDGIFSFIVYDSAQGALCVGRDPIGVCPLYIGTGRGGYCKGSLCSCKGRGTDAISSVECDFSGCTVSHANIRGIWISSEQKALADDCDAIMQFPPGHIAFESLETLRTGEFPSFVRYFKPSWLGLTQEEESDLLKKSITDSGSVVKYNESATGPVSLELPVFAQHMRPLKEPEVKFSGDKTFHDNVDVSQAVLDGICAAFEAAVIKRIPEEVPYCVFLSGGLDSSLVAAVASRYEKAKGRALHSYSVGLEGAPDLEHARLVAKQLGTVHHEVTFTVREGLDAIPHVIKHIETFDVTTIRASTPMYLLARRVRSDGFRVALSGEGSDEMFGGYLYFYNAPDNQSLQQELVARVTNLHTSDCLRANKSTMAWGVEARVPFLDIAFLDLVMRLPAGFKRCVRSSDPKTARMEKWILRYACKSLLSESVLWRQKEQFSDGVGYSWIDGIREHVDKAVMEGPKWQARCQSFDVMPPATHEALFFRKIFEKIYANPACLGPVTLWTPRTDWGCAADPSGRAQSVHEHTNAQ